MYGGISRRTCCLQHHHTVNIPARVERRRTASMLLLCGNMPAGYARAPAALKRNQSGKWSLAVLTHYTRICQSSRQGVPGLASWAGVDRLLMDGRAAGSLRWSAWIAVRPT
jgi:hypothetical protein